jgi:filamentous hemagglutinin family protein
MRLFLGALPLAGTVLLALPALAPSAWAQAPDARPQGGAVVAGQASITQTPQRTQVEQSSQRAVIEWRGFDIGANHHVDIRQPDAAAWSLQRVTGPDPSAIAGRLTSNGGVVIVNPAGIVFHQGAQVDVAGLIATASDTTNQAFMAGRMVFDGAPRPGARVENQGTITLRDQGLAALVGPVAANSGTIRARMGRVAIAGAEAVTIDLAGDGLLSFDVTRQVAGGALATNSGTIAAEGGHVLLTAQAASGLVESVVEAGGRIVARDIAAHAPGGEVRVPAGAVLDASRPAGGGRVTVGAAPGSAIRAPHGLAARTTVEPGATLRADATEAGAGGTVIVHSAQRTRMSGGISARGAGGGPGGQVEVSSRGTVRLDGWVTVGQGGSVLIDSEEVRIVETPDGDSDIAVAIVNETEGDFVVEAARSIHVLAEVDRSAGPLTLRTTNDSAAPGDGIAIEAPLRVLGDLRLLTAGDITQADGARIAAGTLFAESRAGAVRLDASDNAIGALDGGGAAGHFSVTSSRRLAVDAPLGAASIALTSAEGLAIFAPLTATGDVTLVATGAEGIVQAASGAGIAAAQLRAEAPIGPVSLDGAGNRVATLGDSQAGGGFTLRNAGALDVAGNVNAAGTALSLTAETGDLTQQAETRLVAARLAVAAPAGGVRLDAAGNAIDRVSGTARDGIAIRTAGALTLEGTGLQAASVTLDAQGDIGQETDALVVTGLLRARSEDGAVRLQDPLNRIGALGDSAAATELMLGTEGALRVTGAVAAPLVALTAAEGISQDGGTIRADVLRAIALTGAVALDGPGNAIGALGDSGGATGFALATTGALRAAGDVTSGGALSLRADSLALKGALRGASVQLTATQGDIAQSGGAITATTLRAEAAGEVRLDAAGNAIAAISGRAGTVFRVRSSSALMADDIGAEAVALVAGGPITQPATGHGITAGLLTAAAEGAVELLAPANAIAALGPVATPEGLVLRGGVALELTAPLDLPLLDLDLGGALTQRSGATVAAGLLRLDVLGDARLDQPGNRLPRVALAVATGDLTLVTEGSLGLEGLVRAGGELRLAASDSIVQTAGRIEAPVLVATATGGNVLLELPENLVDAAGGNAAGSWRLRNAATGTLELAVLIAAPDVGLTLAGGLAQGQGALRADALTLDVAGSVVLDGDGHRVAALSGRAGSVRLDAGGPLDVTGALASGGELALAADRIGLHAPASATQVLLVARDGDVTQAATGAGLRVTGGLEVYASGAVALAGADNQVARLAGGSAEGGFVLATAGALTVRGDVAGETVVLRAGGVLTLDGATFAAGRAVLIAAPSGIAAGDGSRLEARDPARLPVLILDSRASGLVAIPDFVEPDLPGRAAAVQPTQLVQFGAARNVGAGGVVFDIAAGGAPVFLLVDAGPVLGALEAGRLGVLGLGGTAFLVGALGGVGGEPAATLASAAGAPESYRFNNCPIGLANCGAPPPNGGGTGGGGAGGGGGGGGSGGGTGGGGAGGGGGGSGGGTGGGGAGGGGGGGGSGGGTGGGGAGGGSPPVGPSPEPPAGLVLPLLLPVPLLLVDLAKPPGDVPTTSLPAIIEEREADASR